jgi:cytochrome c oxidase assembly protein subunit 11
MKSLVLLNHFKFRLKPPAILATIKYDNYCTLSHNQLHRNPFYSKFASSQFSSPVRILYCEYSNQSASIKAKNRKVGKYLLAVAILTLGLSYLAVPLYRIFCAHTGYGGTTQRDAETERKEALGTKLGREMRVSFTADASPKLHWTFKPQQSNIQLRVGEPVLAFYTATNHRNVAVTGVATYNVTPMKVGYYFHKVQCFCFDEQRLRPGESVDMPVFFYIDPKIEQDKRCDDVSDIVLSYTFFEMETDEEENEETVQAIEQNKQLHEAMGVKAQHQTTNNALPIAVNKQ